MSETAARLPEESAERAFEGASPVRGVPVGVRRAVKTAVRTYAVATSPLRYASDSRFQ